MSFFSKRKKSIPDGKYRIIKIGKDALLELIYESIIDNQESYFDVTDGTEIVTAFEINWDTGELICVARNLYSDNKSLQFDIDVKSLISKIQDTTSTLYAPNRYIEMSKEDIKNL